MPGESLAGKIVEYKADVKTKMGLRAIVVVQSDLGLRSVWLSAGLKDRLTPKDVHKMVYIERVADTPSKKKGRNPMKTYLVGVK
jgi:hypothetical protein